MNEDTFEDLQRRSSLLNQLHRYCLQRNASYADAEMLSVACSRICLPLKMSGPVVGIARKPRFKEPGHMRGREAGITTTSSTPNFTNSNIRSQQKARSALQTPTILFSTTKACYKRVHPQVPLISSITIFRRRRLRNVVSRRCRMLDRRQSSHPIHKTCTK